MADNEVTEGGSNVFADLGFADAEEELLKAHLTYRVHRSLVDRGLARAEAAELLGVTGPQVSMLMHNRSGNLSVGRLLQLLTSLGQDVQITVKPATPERIRGQVRLAATAQP